VSLFQLHRGASASCYKAKTSGGLFFRCESLFDCIAMGRHARLIFLVVQKISFALISLEFSFVESTLSSFCVILKLRILFGVTGIVRIPFIWCDLFDDDLILPLNGSGDYVLKVMNLFDVATQGEFRKCDPLSYKRNILFVHASKHSGCLYMVTNLAM
jgi:hypothetical protein